MRTSISLTFPFYFLSALDDEFPFGLGFSFLSTTSLRGFREKCLSSTFRNADSNWNTKSGRKRSRPRCRTYFPFCFFLFSFFCRSFLPIGFFPFFPLFCRRKRFGVRERCKKMRASFILNSCCGWDRFKRSIKLFSFFSLFSYFFFSFRPLKIGWGERPSGLAGIVTDAAGISSPSFSSSAWRIPILGDSGAVEKIYNN